MKRLLLAVVLLLVLAVVADRGAAALASRSVAEQAQQAAGLPQPPEVTLHGIPFLTQAVAGRYERVDVTARAVPAGELVLDRLDATLTGVRVPLRQALSGSAERVPVERVEARALVGYGQLSQRSGDRQLTVAPGDAGRVRVTGSVELLGRTLSAVAVSRVEVVDGALVVTAEELEVGNEVANALATRALAGRLDLTVPVQGLPYGLQLTGVDVTPGGVVARATATDVVLTPP